MLLIVSGTRGALSKFIGRDPGAPALRDAARNQQEKS